jgi:hypothetical protein
MKFIRVTIIILLTTALVMAASVGAACEKTEPLFIVKRSKNGNIVHYDACLKGSSDLSDTDPVIVYWMLENWKREQLNKIEQKYAYGISSWPLVGKNKTKITIPSMKDRKIIVEQVADHYRALIIINGRESILEKVYVKSKELLIGLPNILSIDLYGRTRAEISQLKSISHSKGRPQKPGGAKSIHFPIITVCNPRLAMATAAAWCGVN